MLTAKQEELINMMTGKERRQSTASRVQHILRSHGTLSRMELFRLVHPEDVEPLCERTAMAQWTGFKRLVSRMAAQGLIESHREKGNIFFKIRA